MTIVLRGIAEQAAACHGGRARRQLPPADFRRVWDAILAPAIPTPPAPVISPVLTPARTADVSGNGQGKQRTRD